MVYLLNVSTFHLPKPSFKMRKPLNTTKFDPNTLLLLTLLKIYQRVHFLFLMQCIKEGKMSLFIYRCHKIKKSSLSISISKIKQSNKLCNKSFPTINLHISSCLAAPLFCLSKPSAKLSRHKISSVKMWLLWSKIKN